MSLNRRQFLQAGATLAASNLLPALRAWADDRVELPFANGIRPLVRYPQKRPLIRLTTRPPQLETPFSLFDQSLLTPNDAFFVRYHLAGIPTEIDPAAFRLTVRGAVRSPQQFSLAALKSEFERVEIVAVNQCSGNSRGFFQPRVPGGQSGNGAMGNARWTGVRLKDILDRAAPQPGAKQVAYRGLDHPVLPTTPAFVKALDLDHARDGEVMVAYQMNGEELPMLNGFPLRLVVPGCYGTYWVKHLSDLNVLESDFTGFWMSQAYRIPATPNASIPPGTLPASTLPIGRFNIRSFITSLADGAVVPAGKETVVRGIAFDGGHGISQVGFSCDGGQRWVEAGLGRDLGRYSFRPWTVTFRPEGRGPCVLMSRASNRAGEIQPLKAGWNPSGYMRNVVETVRISVV